VWIDKRLPSLRRHPAYGVAASCGLILAAILLKLIFPDLPSFLPLYPVVLLSALLGGRAGGIIAWIACTILGTYYFAQTNAFATAWSYSIIAGFSAVCALIVFVLDLLDRSIRRLELERNRLDLALQAANLATWELHSDGRLHWDDSFYRMVGLDPAQAPPSTERFLSMIHPDDRARMQHARDRMNRGKSPPQRDEYRLTRPDGRLIWLENYRAGTKGDSQHFIGITQDISARKRYERRINALMRELAHRVKNQYAVILAMVRETNKQARSPAEFENLLQARISALSRSHDLLVHGEWESADLKDLLVAHIEAFGLAERLAASGPAISLSAMAAQYFGMAFHELCTNAVKHGALSVPQGRVQVSWEIHGGEAEHDFTLTWQEIGGPAIGQAESAGFGSKVLNHLMPAAISGKSQTEMVPQGLIWRLNGRLAAMRSSDAQGEAKEDEAPVVITR
jgi:PAS domain S-box-containing protein